MAAVGSFIGSSVVAVALDAVTGSLLKSSDLRGGAASEANMLDYNRAQAAQPQRTVTMTAHWLDLSAGHPDVVRAVRPVSGEVHRTVSVGGPTVVSIDVRRGSVHVRAIACTGDGARRAIALSICLAPARGRHPLSARWIREVDLRARFLDAIAIVITLNHGEVEARIKEKREPRCVVRRGVIAVVDGGRGFTIRPRPEAWDWIAC